MCRVLQSDLDESATELKSAVEQSKRAALDAAHLADELRQEQERSMQLEKMRKLQETQLRELQVHC